MDMQACIGFETEA